MGPSSVIFDGGLLKLPALLGAFSMLNVNIFWESYIGYGAGSILAVLLAAGYTSKEIEVMARDFQYLKTSRMASLPIIGPLLCMLLNFNMYDGDALEQWIREALNKKKVHTFSDFANIDGTFKVSLLCADMRKQQIIALPYDIGEIEQETDPQRVEVAKAVRIAACGQTRSLIERFITPIYRRNKAIIDEAELCDHIYKSTPVFHVKVVRDEPTPSCRFPYSPAGAEMFKPELAAQPRLESYLVEIDNVRGRYLMYWDDQYRIGVFSAVDMLQRDILASDETVNLATAFSALPAPGEGNKNKKQKIKDSNTNNNNTKRRHRHKSQHPSE